jgi:4-amino-4-deoxy-L-arabinose transferase-like glycosyltransferase
MTIKPSRDRSLLILLLTISAVYRIWTIMMIHTGVDERDYWFSAKALTSDAVDYPYVNHRTVRWAVIIPVALQQLVTGTGPNAYYVMPTLNALAQTALLYLLGKKIKNRRTGFIAALLLCFFPYQIRAASQVRPEIFSMTLILLVLYFLLEFFEKRGRVFLLLSSFFLFTAYLAKVTNLFFLPAVVALLFLYRRERWVSSSLWYGGLLLLLFAAETFCYRLAGYPLGQLSVILGNHVADMETLDSFIQIFRRYSFENLQPYWHLPFAVFFVLGVYSIAKNRRRELMLLIVPVFCFFFFITFTISGLRPLKMAEPFVNRYFCAILPPVFLVIAWYAEALLSGKALGSFLSRRILPLGYGGAALFILVFSLPFMPGPVKEFIRPPLPGAGHPFFLNREYQREINRAFAEKTPVVSVDDDALYTASWYYLSPEFFHQRRAPGPEHPENEQFPRLAVLGTDAPFPAREALALVIRPFRVRRMGIDELAGLEERSFYAAGETNEL